MIMNTLMEEIKNLPVIERIQVVEEIWDSIAGESAEISLSEAEKEELNRRIESFRKNPDGGRSWETLKKEILNR